MFAEIQSEIQKSLSQNDRSDQEIILVAVSKKKTIDEVLQLVMQGARHFGENYVQEAVEKIGAVPDTYREQLRWHMIGQLQSNKAKVVAKTFDWVQSVDSIRLARLLSRHREGQVRPLNICIQLNIDNAKTKSGVVLPEVGGEEGLLELVKGIAQLPNLVLRGIMVVPDVRAPKETLCAFRKAHEVFVELKSHLALNHAKKFDTLSMGMSGDYKLAIAGGSTMVRIGTALFGARENA